MKVGKITDGQGGDHYQSNDSKSRMLAHSAVSYWDIASRINDKSQDNFDLIRLMLVGVPVMHMAVELIVKAMVAISDDQFVIERDGHNTPKIIHDHANIAVIGAIDADKRKMELVGELRKAWIDLRYAQGTLMYEAEDKQNFDEIMTTLTEEFKRLSGLNML